MHEYIAAALQTARFDQLHTGGWFGAIPQFHVVMAAAASRADCYWAIKEDLEAAVHEALQHGRPLPALAGVETPTLERTA